MNKITLFILLAWLPALADITPPPPPVGCQILVPSPVNVGEAILISMYATGPVESMELDGQPVSVPSAKKVVRAVSPGQFRVLGTVKSRSDSGTCMATYQVKPTTPVWTMNPVVLPAACANQFYKSALGAFVTSPSGAPVTFRALRNTGWIQVSGDGNVYGTPLNLLGKSEVEVLATSATGDSATATVQIEVRDCTLPTTPELTAAVGQPQSFYLPRLIHLNGDYVKIAGPAWANVSLSGVLTGTPGLTDVGTSTLTVSVDNDDLAPREFSFLVRVIAP